MRNGRRKKRKKGRAEESENTVFCVVFNIIGLCSNM